MEKEELDFQLDAEDEGGVMPKVVVNDDEQMLSPVAPISPMDVSAAQSAQLQVQQQALQLAQLQTQLNQCKNLVKEAQKETQNLKNQVTVAQAVAAKEKQRFDDVTVFANRMQADFDNYRKRTNETIKKSETDGVIKIIEKILPVLDVFKQAVVMITDEKVAEGVKMIYRQLSDALISFGLEEIPALGEKFDPELHNAVVQVKVKDKEQAGIIVEVFQKGYRLGERIVRHSAVKVAN